MLYNIDLRVKLLDFGDKVLGLFYIGLDFVQLRSLLQLVEFVLKLAKLVI